MKINVVLGLVFFFSVAPLVAGEIRTPDQLTADFTIERKIAALSDTITSTGKLYLGGPGLLRWETLTPSRSTLVIRQREAWIHFPDFNVTKNFNINDDPAMKILAGHLLVLAKGDIGQIAVFYTVTRSAEMYVLSPKEPKVKQLFSEIRVLLDASGVARRVAMISANGDTTTIFFTKIRFDLPVRAELFAQPAATPAKP